MRFSSRSVLARRRVHRGTLCALGLALLVVQGLWTAGCKPQTGQQSAQQPAGPPEAVEPPAKPAGEPQTITLYCGAAGRLGIDEVAVQFEKDHPGVTVSRAYGGSGTVLSQAMVAEKGDVYVPGSDDFMDTAEKKGAVIPETRKIVCYLVPMIGVQKGNPKGIKTLQDMAKPGVKVGVGAPKAVCLGDIAVEVFEKAGLTDKIKPNIVTHGDSCGAVETLLKLKKVDAVIGWDVFAVSSPKEIEVIPLPEGLTARRNIPAAVFKFTKNRALAEEFVKFIAESEFSHEAFKKHGFTVE